MTTRVDGRSSDALRPIEIEIGVQKNPEGSVLYRCGGTRVLVSVSVDEGVPSWMRGKGAGWITAEYAMHPRANPNRQDRDGRKGRGVDGRTQEIQRLIGRSLRSAIDLSKLGERQIVVDCDVLDADGGTRTASITAGFVGLALALDKLRRAGSVAPGVVRAQVAAISAGLVGGKRLLDLSYPEDSKADVDLNVVATAKGDIVEVQGTSEGAPVPRTEFDALIDLSLASFIQLGAAQTRALSAAKVELGALMVS